MASEALVELPEVAEARGVFQTQATACLMRSKQSSVRSCVLKQQGLQKEQAQHNPTRPRMSPSLQPRLPPFLPSSKQLL